MSRTMTGGEEGPYSVAINTGGPRDPEYVLELATAFAEIVRALNHLTRDHAALEYPAQADTVLRSLAAAAERLPQLLGQLAGWLEAERNAGRLEVAWGDYGGRLDEAVAAVTAALRLTGPRACKLLTAELDRAASVLSTIGAAGRAAGGGAGG